MCDSQTKFCSKCGTDRGIDEFSSFQGGKSRKTCNRHVKKRDLNLVHNNWDEFLNELEAWNNLEQSDALELEELFNLDSLPVAFGTELPSCEQGHVDRSPLNSAIRSLAHDIWARGSFRFRRNAVSLTNGRFYYYYQCSQDKEQAPTSSTVKSRDRREMVRFDCQSKLSFSPRLDVRTLHVSVHHAYHEPYNNVQLSQEILDFIEPRLLTSTAPEIMRDLVSARIHGFDKAILPQIYYRWQSANSKIWRKADDQFVSARQLLDEHGCSHKMLESTSHKAITLYNAEVIQRLASSIKEISIDSTYGTNNFGMELFAVMAEVDGAGIPLAYCFIQKSSTVAGSRASAPGTLTSVLVQFLQQLKSSGINPIFIGHDKDKSEIAAVDEVWPRSHHQLCYWHAKRAVKQKLQDSTKAHMLQSYRPEEASQVIPELEMCWGSHSNNRPSGDHRYGRCHCPSRRETYAVSGRCESTKEERHLILEMFSDHYNAHPFIPDIYNTFCSPEQIHRKCASEMYLWCRSRNYFYLWSYLWVNWYQPPMWKLWARSTHPSMIPVLKTTMIVESHWRRLKHDYLHRFNRPRIDLVLWVIISKVLPDAFITLNHLRQGNFRQARSSWRKDFKHEFNNLATRQVSLDSISRYHTNPVQWVCACPTFAKSRFLICKHILYCFLPIMNHRWEFFNTISRCRTVPFWKHDQLVLKPEFHHFKVPIVESSNAEDSSDEDVDLFPQLTLTAEDPAPMSDTEEYSTVAELDNFQLKVEGVLAELRGQLLKGNAAVVDNILQNPKYTALARLHSEIQTEKRQRTMPRTWDRARNPVLQKWNF